MRKGQECPCYKIGQTRMSTPRKIRHNSGTTPYYCPFPVISLIFCVSSG